MWGCALRSKGEDRGLSPFAARPETGPASPSRGLRYAALMMPLLSLLISAPALAESVDIDVTAEIPVRCGFAPGGTNSVSAPRDLESAATLSIRVGLDCNAPFALGITVENGALINLDASEDGSGYAFRKNYGLSVALDTDRGQVRSEHCASSNLVTVGACGFVSAVPGEGLGSGPGISVNRDATLTIDWSDQAAERSRLAPGRYRDTIVIVVGARA